MKNELLDIIEIEQSIPLSWYDWWNYWATFIGIGVFIMLFFFLTSCFYAINPKSINNTNTAIVPTNKNDLELEQMVNTLLTQKRLTL